MIMKKKSNNPINLLIAIKEHLLNYQETRYEMSIITDLIRAFLSKESETLQDYTRQFKTLNHGISRGRTTSVKKIHSNNRRV